MCFFDFLKVALLLLLPALRLQLAELALQIQVHPGKRPFSLLLQLQLDFKPLHLLPQLDGQLGGQELAGEGGHLPFLEGCSALARVFRVTGEGLVASSYQRAPEEPPEANQ